jgi:RNA polymerase sigma factor (sigma-70 family)
MLLNQLFESVKANAAFAFGRFNPPHKGHVAVWNTVAKAGAEWFIGTNPGTSGPKDPLPYDVKTAWMTAIDPNVKGHIMPETSVLTLAVSIYKQLGERQGLTIAYVTDDQDWAWSGKLLNDYNGKEATHGYYNFAKIIHVPSPRVSSATALRDAARAGDMKAFYAASGTDPKLQVDGKNYFETVVDFLNQHPEKVKKPKKVAAPATQEDAAGVGVIASKKQAKDPRYSMSLTKDVRPGAVNKALKAFSLESMLPTSAFAGSDKNKLGPEAHLKGKMKRSARPGDLVGEENPNQQLSLYKPDGKTYRGEPMPTLSKDPVDDADRYGLDHDEPVDQDFDTPELKKHLTKAMSGLPERYQELLRLRYVEEMTFDEIAEKLGVTRERIRQMEAKALRYLRHPSRSDSLASFLENKKNISKNCVKIGEAWENKIASLVEQLARK